MKLQLITLAAATLLACNAMAADPTASLNPNRTWTEYTGTGPVGNNNININDKAYWMFESAGTWMGQAVNSWFVFWDPRSSLQLKGTISFDHDILYVHDSKAELQATAAFGKPGVTYVYSNNLVGLESADASNTSWAGNTLSIKWNASNPGDHIRVMTAVPEPGTYAMFGAGLLALGFMARRRRAS
jgi:hypothetical protein